MIKVTPPPPPRIQKSAESQSNPDVNKHHQDEPGEEKDFGEGFKDAYEDLTDVSIPALIAFLEGLIGRIPESGMAPETPVPNTPNAMAAQAYQSHAPNAQTPPPPPPDEREQSALDQVAQGMDHREIRGLIRELMQLSQKGVGSLSLEKSDSFLDSIRQAIKSS